MYMYVSLCTKAYRKTKVTDVLGNNNFTDMFLIFFSRIGLQVGKSLCVHVCLCVMSGEDEKKKRVVVWKGHWFSCPTATTADRNTRLNSRAAEWMGVIQRERQRTAAVTEWSRWGVRQRGSEYWWHAGACAPSITFTKQGFIGKLGGVRAVAVGQGEDEVIQFGGKGRYQRTSHLAEIEKLWVQCPPETCAL